MLAEGEAIGVEDFPEEVRLAARGPIGITPTEEITAEVSGSGSPAAAPQDERDRLLGALRSSGGNKARAARSLGLPRSTFFSQLKKHGLD